VKAAAYAAFFLQRSCILLKRSTDRVRRLALAGIALLLVLLLAGCGGAAQNAAQTSAQASPSPQPTQAAATQPASTAQASTPAPASQSSTLQGPTNFLLTTPFNFSSVNGATMDDNGAATPLAASMVKTEITGEMKRLLFVVDSDNNLKVYSPGESPVAAHLTSQSDGSTSIAYTQTLDSDAGTINIIFSGSLNNGQIAVNYEQQYTPSMLINAQASDVYVSFTTQVKWVAPNQIPAAPSNGQSQPTSSGGVALSWSAGQNAVAYDVYRLISDQDQEFQLLATVKGTSYIDNSQETKQNMNDLKGITYVIFSVGPTGVENPGGIVISV
jgi:hypothetical protein